MEERSSYPTDDNRNSSLTSLSDPPPASSVSLENILIQSDSPVPENNLNDDSSSMLKQENQKLQQQIKEALEQLDFKAKIIEELQVQNNEFANTQLNDRIRKTIAVLVRFSTSAETIPDQIPDLFREAIQTIRSHTINILHENTELRRQCEQLDTKLNMTMPQLHQLSVLREQKQAQAEELEAIQRAHQEKEDQMLALEVRYDSLKDRFQAFQKEHEKVKNQLHHYRIQTEQSEHRLQILNSDHENALEQLKHLKMALDIVQETQATETQYKLNSLERKIDYLKEENEKLESKYQNCTNEKIELDLKLMESQTKTEELRKEIESLNHHLNYRLSEIGKQHEIDRQWIGNHIIQFYLHPEQRKDIMLLLSNILGFTEEQKLAVGLKSDSVPFIKPHSLSDQWISFLLKEAHDPKE